MIETASVANVKTGARSAIGILFFLSGLSSLVYEVIWMRRLSLFFGSDVYSAAFTLSAFMGGLMVGSLIAARYADRVNRPLFWYGLLEVCIGCYALFFPQFLDLFSHQYQTVYRTYFEASAWYYHAFRMSIAVVTLIIPTTMMGMTLPVLVRHFAREGKIGEEAGWLYSTNTCGALAGVLISGFILLPQLGITATTRIAVAVNELIGMGAIIGSYVVRRSATAGQAELVAETDTPATEPVFDARAVRSALIAISLSGIAALALEVVWTRILEQSFSGTVYSFSIMLACFLFGIFYGSKRVSSVVDGHPSLVHLFGRLQVGLALSVAVLSVLTYLVPLLFSNLLWSLNRLSGKFGIACTAAEIVVSVILIGLPTALMGAAFPVAAAICTPALGRIGRGVGTTYAANTAGGILGALLGGMILIPALGTRVSLLVIAAIFGVAGLLLLEKYFGSFAATLRDPETAAMLFFSVICAAIVSFLPRQIVTNFYYAGRDQGQLVYHGEGVRHNVDIIKTPDGVTIMQVNGTIEAGTDYDHLRHFILKAHLPLLLAPNPHDVAVVGLGLGITLSATNRYPDVRSIRVIELTPEMVKAHEHLEDISGGVLRSPKIHLRIDDGRNFMAMADQHFDMITADPIHPSVTGVGYLYTKEYYESIKRRLRPDGVVCQWMPMYRISKNSFDVAFRTFATVFPNASFWYVKGHGLFVATLTPFQIDLNTLSARMRSPLVQRDLDSIDIHDATQLVAHMLMGPDEIARYLASTPDQTINTDDNAYLEYHTPFEFLESTEAIVKGLIPYSAPGLRNLTDVAPEDRKKLAAAWTVRMNDLLPELDAARN